MPITPCQEYILLGGLLYPDAASLCAALPGWLRTTHEWQHTPQTIEVGCADGEHWHVGIEPQGGAWAVTVPGRCLATPYRSARAALLGALVAAYELQDAARAS